MKKKPYSFLPPEEVTFEALATEYLPNFDQIDEETRQKTLQVYAQTYTCFGSPYFTIPNCPEGS